MDRKCHEIVYMKSWPNIDSKLLIYTILTDFRVYVTSLLTFTVSIDWCPHYPLKLKKHECTKPACHSDASMPLNKSFDHIWAFIFILLSSQGGYTMAYCQKEIRWRRAPTQMLLYFEGAAVPTADLQLLVLWAHTAALVETSRGWAGGLHLFFLGLTLAVKTREEDQLGILRCLSCDQVGKRFTNAGTQNNRLFKK